VYLSTKRAFFMRHATATVTYLADYQVPDYLIDRVSLVIRLDGAATCVDADLSIRRNPKGQSSAPLKLDGDELTLLALSLNGAPLSPSDYTVSETGLVIATVPDHPFTLSVRTRLDPDANTKLMGLYRSSGTYCTQCEAEGFRRITYFIDRPDVMSVYTTRIEARQDEAPVLLGNGNPQEKGALPDGFHYAVWHDPHPKPAYLFALVGGRLDKITQTFTTRSGKAVELAIYVEPGKSDRALYAMDALVRSMIWDEESFGCEYDLDVFNIVAVSDFNMGAMENKGLNIFNDKYVLASPETATDGDYAGIESVIAHEYFHNWTGNRITCRDWFQLCLKEGLTVFRDQEFTADTRSRAVKRIADVRTLRAAQFSEDSGPLAHAVRPSSYREINNFYTPTIYEKGAEIIRMLKTMLGPDQFRQGMALYLNRCDGTAATVEEFIACFAEVSGHALDAFFHWYVQAGTPVVDATHQYDPAHKRLTLHFKQHTPATPGQADKRPLPLPIAYGLVGTNGEPLVPASGSTHTAEGIYLLEGAEGQMVFEGLADKPVPSLLRNFSAPVRLQSDLGHDEFLTLFQHDSDPFNRWQSAQNVAMAMMVEAIPTAQAGRPIPFNPRFAETLGSLLAASDDHAFVAQVLALPSENDIAREIQTDIDPDAIFKARTALRAAIGRQIAPILQKTHAALAQSKPFSPDARSAGRRALRNASLDLLVAGDPDTYLPLAKDGYDKADNMTDRIAALTALCQTPNADREAALQDFATRYESEALALDKWFALQASLPEDATLDRVKKLMQHPGFSMTNPNRVRSLVGAFCMSNPTQFNRLDGAGYDFLAEIVMTLDHSNPQVAARILSAFRTWRAFEPRRRAKAGEALRRISDQSSLSADVADIVVRSLA
jgi:aminopeptidase N